MPPTPAPKPTTRPNDAPRRNSLGVTPAQLSELVKRLESSPNAGKSREFIRWTFANTEMQVQFEHPGGSRSEARLCARNLSRQGISLLHNTYVYQGTRVRIDIPTLDGKLVSAVGVVQRCSHRGGVVHEIGVKFDQPIELARHIAPNAGERTWAYENIAPEKLQGAAMLATSSAIERRIATHFLRQSSVRIVHADSVEQFVEGVGGVDLALCDEQFLEKGGEAIVRALRMKGTPTPLLLITEHPALAQAVGAFATLSRPLNQQHVLRAIAEVLLGRKASDVPDASVAAVTIDTDMRDAFHACVADLVGAVQKEDLNAMLNGCAQLQAAAPVLGLPLVGRLASIALSQLPVTTSPDERHMLVRELVSACEQALPKAA